MTPEQEARAAKVFDLLLKRYEDMLENGIQVQTGTDSEGNAILASIPPSAAMVGKIQDFLEKHEIGRSGTGTEKNGVAGHVERLRLKLTHSKMPALSEADDAATA